jgi:hypothetical protein
MNINFKTNVKTVIRYKGQEYSSADALPAEARSAYEAAFAKGIAAIPGAKQQIVFNGQHFASADEMPPAEKKLYEDAMGLVQDGVVVHQCSRSQSFLVGLDNPNPDASCLVRRRDRGAGGDSAIVCVGRVSSRADRFPAATSISAVAAATAPTPEL